MNKREIKDLASEINVLVFERLDQECDITGNDAGKMASECEKVVESYLETLMKNDKEDNSIINGRKLLEMGLWDEFCRIRGMSVWCLNEGRLDSRDDLNLTVGEMVELGLIKKSYDW